MTAVAPGLGLAPLVQVGFTIRPEVQADSLVVNVSGNGDMAAVEALGRYLKQLHKEALHLAVTEVGVDIRDLYFMNSSCLKSFVAWIDSVLNDDKPLYRIRFFTDPKLLWQRRSLEALRRLAPEVVHVES